MAQRADEFDVIVVGGGHAGAEAAWACANLGVRTALVTLDPSKIGVMSCNPAIGGLAKGQIVREIDALGGLMARAADATGIHFKVLNTSKGPAVRGPRAQCDRHAYAREVRRLLGTRPQIEIVPGAAERFIVEPLSDARPRVRGIEVVHDGRARTLSAGAVVLTTGTFMRGLMHTGESRSEGGRIGEAPAVGVSAALRGLGFELGRLKTGTPPRLRRSSIDWDALEPQTGDDPPAPFSDLTDADPRFPALAQIDCRITSTNEAIHAAIRANLHRAPMYSGQIESLGPRYCPSIEDKVVRFAGRSAHHVFLEPESHESDWVYCNGISTSLPRDVQESMVRAMPGCARAEIVQFGYAVEYDMVRPHQIDAGAMSRLADGLFLAGQINGTSGYEEAAAQGVIAGINAVRFIRNESLVRLRRDQAYIGVLMDDLVTKTPREPYRMFTSRAEHRLLLRGDNTDERLTPLGRELGTVDDTRWSMFEERRVAVAALKEYMGKTKAEGVRLIDWARRPQVDAGVLDAKLNGADLPALSRSKPILSRVLADIQYAGYIEREAKTVQKLAATEEVALPSAFDYARITGLRKEAKNVLSKFKPTTLGQASRLAGVTPADIMLLTVAIGR